MIGAAEVADSARRRNRQSGERNRDLMETLNLDFSGPFSFLDRGDSIFRAACGGAAGVYLWTIRQRDDSTHMMHYVDETVSLAKRHREHLIHILGLNYGIFDPDKAQEGICEPIWPGLWRNKSPDGPGRQVAAYQSFHSLVLRYLSVLKIFFAPLEVDTRLRRPIEGCIGWNLRNNHPADKALYPDDNHVGTMSEKNHGELVIAAPDTIRGLDERILY